MATWELQLISRVVRTGELNSIIQWGITPNDFLTNEGRALFSTLQSYFAQPGTTGAVIGPFAVQQMFPNFHLCDDTSMTTEALCVEVRKQRLAIDMKARVKAALELCDFDPMRAIGQLQSGMLDLQNVGMSSNVDVHFHNAFDRVVQKYMLIKQGVDLSCGRWPWSPLQEATMGLQPDDYIVIYGRPKSMKSWVLAYLIAWFYNMGKRMVIYTKEMTADNIFQRAGACLALVRYQEFRTGKLSYEEEQAILTVQRMLHLAQVEQTVVCLSAKDATAGGDTVPWLRAKLEQHQPHLGIVDGMYLMSDASGAKKDNQRVQNISRALRQTVLDTGVPIIATVQANRDAAKNTDANLDEIAFSDAIGQDATLLMRAINERDKPTIALVMSGASREFSLSGFRIYGQPATNFEYAGEITDKEIEKAKEQDSTDEAGNAKAVPAGNGKKKSATAQSKAPTETSAANAVNDAVYDYVYQHAGGPVRQHVPPMAHAQSNVIPLIPRQE